MITKENSIYNNGDIIYVINDDYLVSQGRELITRVRVIGYKSKTILNVESILPPDTKAQTRKGEVKINKIVDFETAKKMIIDFKTKNLNNLIIKINNTKLGAKIPRNNI